MTFRIHLFVTALFISSLLRPDMSAAQTQNTTNKQPEIDSTPLFRTLSQSDSLVFDSPDAIVVTATRTGIKQSHTGKVTTVITPSVIDRNRGKSLAQLLQQNSLLYINGASGSPGNNQELSLWGGASGYTLILLDGVPLRDPSQISQAADLNHINPEQIERIEILSGAQSTLWGSDAVAGVINVISNKAPSSLDSFAKPTLTVSRGVHKDTRVQAGLTGRNQKLSYLISYGYHGSDGFSAATPRSDVSDTDRAAFDRDGLTQHRALLTSTYRVTDALTLQARSLFSSYDTDLDAGAFQDDRDYTAERKLFSHSLQLQYVQDRLSLTLQQALTQSDRFLMDDSTHIGGFAKWAEGRYEGEAAITDMYGVVKLSDALTLVSGGQFIRQQTQQTYQSLSAFGLFRSQPISRADSRTNAFSLYSSLLFEKNRWNLESGFRFNSHSIYNQHTTFTVNPVYRITENSRVFLNISSGYKIPSLYQLYSEYGNLDLRPESSLNVETGFHTGFLNGLVDLRLVGFKRDISDLIVFYTDENWVSSYVNRDKQHDIGFQAETRITFTALGSWQNSLLYVRGEGRIDGVKTENLYRRPNILLNSQFLLAPTDRWTLQASFRYAGKRLKGPFDSGPDRLPPYYTLGLYGEIIMNEQVRFFADVQNLTDQRFDEVPGYSTMGRNAALGVTIRF